MAWFFVICPLTPKLVLNFFYKHTWHIQDKQFPNKMWVVPKYLGLVGPIFDKKNVEKIFLGYLRGTPTWVPPKNCKTCQLEAFIRQWKGTLGIFCLTLFKSPCQEVFQTPLTLIKAIILAHLVAVQSSEIFKILTTSHSS